MIVDNAIEEDSEKECGVVPNVSDVSFVEKSLKQVDGQIHRIHAFHSAAAPVHSLGRNETFVGDFCEKRAKRDYLTYSLPPL